MPIFETKYETQRCSSRRKLNRRIALNDDVIADRGMLDEGLWFIQKPFFIKDLAVKVYETLGRE